MLKNRMRKREEKTRRKRERAGGEGGGGERENEGNGEKYEGERWREGKKGREESRTGAFKAFGSNL